MELNRYQELAGRTINQNLNKYELERHALHGMVSEVGELTVLYQKQYQGHPFDEEHAKKEVGDIFWFLAEYCECKGWNMEEVAMMNIEKLKKRYPKGFEDVRSLERAKGDI